MSWTGKRWGGGTDVGAVTKATAKGGNPQSAETVGGYAVNIGGGKAVDVLDTKVAGACFVKTE